MVYVKKCCGCFTTRTGALIIAVLSLVASCIQFVHEVIMPIHYGYFTLDFITLQNGQDPCLIRVDEKVGPAVGVLCTILAAIDILISSLLVSGIRSDNSKRMLPWIIYGFVVCIIIVIITHIFMIVGLVFGIYLFLIVLVYIFAMIVASLNLYFITVVYSHYQDLERIAKSDPIRMA